MLSRTGANEVEEQTDVRLLEFLVNGVIGCGGNDWPPFSRGHATRGRKAVFRAKRPEGMRSKRLSHNDIGYFLCIDPTGR